MQNVDLILVDGSSYLYRAFYVPQLKRMSNAKGEPTGAIFGTVHMIKSLQKEYPQSKIIVVFDAKGKTFRHDLYSEYKSHRPPMPDELRSQIAPLHRLIIALGYPLVSIQGVEADDVLGSYAKLAAKQGQNVLIATGDKDMAQVVNDRIHLIDTMKKVILNPQGVKEKFGVHPEQIVDYLSLMGDSADNIPGVPKVGPKTAVKWLDEYRSVDKLIKNAALIKGKVGENLREFIPQFPLTKELVTLNFEVKIECPCVDFDKSEENTAEVIALYQLLGFKKWLQEIGGSEAEKAAANWQAGQYHNILTQKDFDELVGKLQNVAGFCFDTETTALEIRQAKLVGISFCFTHAQAYYIPLGHDYDGAPEQLSLMEVMAKLKPIFEDESIAKIGQNIKYDMNILRQYDILVKGELFDTMLASYVLDSVAGRHDMDSLSVRHLHYSPQSYTDIVGKGKAQKKINQIDVDTVAFYAAEDADVTWRLHHVLMPKLVQNPGLHYIYQHVEMPLVRVLAHMEYYGVLIDDTLLYQQSQTLAQHITQQEQAAFSLARVEFNMASPKQIQEILYEKMQLPVLKNTPKGAPSTAEEVLQELAIQHELPRLILRHRSLGKLKSTYTDKLPLMIEKTTQRVHTSYHQAVTATGRLSSSDPNLQNIPIRSAEGRLIREAFVAPTGHKIVALDYSQIELRIMAHLSEDDTLLTAFRNEADVHQITASEIFDVPLERVSEEQRRDAKAVNFGLMYGMSAFGLAKQLQVDRKKAQSYIDYYFQRYPKVQTYMQNTKERAEELGYVETIFGRRLFLPEIQSKNAALRQYAQRTAINAPMQGSAADIIKLAMLSVQQWIAAKESPITMIMQVHDELVFEIPKEIASESIVPLRECMETVAQLKVPLKVSADSGDNWSQAH